jgi:hypothetical protein
MLHQQTAGYRLVFADGALLRTHKDDLLMTFFYDDMPVISELVQVLSSDKASHRVRPLNEFTSEARRFHEVGVRMKQADALSLATAILQRLANEAPELLENKGIQMLPEEKTP